MLRKLFFFSLLFLSLLFIVSSCHSGESKSSNKPQKDAPVPVEAISAQFSQLSNEIEANGNLESQEFIELRPEASGKLVYLNVPEGSVVGAGTVIGRIFNDDLLAQQKKYKAQLELAQKNEQRLLKLIAINGINQQDYDQAVSQLRSLQADVEFTQAQIQKTQIVAPFTGTIGLRQVSVGAYVSPNTVVATLQQTNALKVDFTIPEAYSDQVKRGMTVQVQPDASSERISGTVIAIEPQISATTRNLKVRATLQNTNANLYSGMFAKVYLTVGKTAEALLIPTQAIIPDTRDKKIALVKNGKVAFTVVETGLRRENDVQITKGLQAGDTVVVSGILFLKPSSIVKIKMKTPQASKR